MQNLACGMAASISANVLVVGTGLFRHPRVRKLIRQSWPVLNETNEFLRKN